MKKENAGMKNTIKYSIWDTRTDEHQPAVEKILKNHRKDIIKPK